MADNNLTSIITTPEKKVSILIIDDDEIDVKGIKRALNQQQLTNPVVRASDGVEGMDILKTKHLKKPYIILLDLNMPRMNGFEFLSQIRSDAELQESIVFVMTTSNSKEDINKSYRMNIAGYIVKSSAKDSFTETVKLLEHYMQLIEFPDNYEH